MNTSAARSMNGRTNFGDKTVRWWATSGDKMCRYSKKSKTYNFGTSYWTDEYNLIPRIQNTMALKFRGDPDARAQDRSNRARELSTKENKDGVRIRGDIRVKQGGLKKYGVGGLKTEAWGG